MSDSELPGLLGLSWIELLSFILACSVSLVLFKSTRPRRVKKLPGPRGIPILGYALQIPKVQSWVKFNQWTKQYGDAFQINTFGQEVVIIGSADAANELLESKGGIYSDRPTTMMAGELAGWNASLAYARGPDHPRFRALRRMFQQYIGPRQCLEPAIVNAQEEVTRDLLGRMLADPDNFSKHIRAATSSLLLRLIYGYRAQRENDQLVRFVEDAMNGFSEASEPGVFWVDNFPILKYIPEWFPLAGFKQKARRFNEDRQKMFDEPFDFTKLQISRHAAEVSFTSRNLEEKQEDIEHATPEDEEIIKAAAASMYGGGGATTFATLTKFVLAMSLFQDVQSRAQAEIDTVLGVGSTGLERLPTLADRNRMPYVNALVREVLRWHPVVPLGLPHRLTQDDLYRGCLISACTTIWPNIWHMTQDERYFPHPAEFKPERYLAHIEGSQAWTLRPLSLAEDPVKLVFGFGRRSCPGSTLADSSLFLMISSMLAILRFSKAVNEEGQEVEPRVWFEGVVAPPAPFECMIKPRYPNVERLLAH